MSSDTKQPTARPRKASATFVLQTLLLLAALVGWQRQAGNHLYANGRWLAGKDTGKFVFYTYDFLFAPLRDGAVNLTSFMGYQEILYRQAEGPDRQLKEVTCHASIDDGAYLWIELQRDGEQMLGFRLSRHADYPAGFYVFDGRGVLQTHQPTDPWTAQPDQASSPRIELRRQDNTWTATVNGQLLGTVQDPGFAGGRLGFRGSGVARRPVLLYDVEMVWTDPSKPARTWTERETFSAAQPSPLKLGTLALLALGVIGLRRTSSGFLGQWLAGGQRAGFRFADDMVLSVTLIVLLLVPKDTHGLVFPTWLAVAELLRLVVWARRRPSASHTAGSHQRLWIYGGAVTLISLLACMTHGEWLGRSEWSTKSILEGIHPDAFRVIPEQRTSSPPFESQEPRSVAFAKPWFIEESAYREQAIHMEFTMETNSTMDLVFQQQSFLTHGDADGEPLPLQRRLVRLTTRPDVPWGLASRTDHRPAPWLALQGAIRVGTNELALVSRGREVMITLNGDVTTIPSVSPLGYGSTGLLGLHGSAEVTSFSVRPLTSQQLARRIRPLAGAAFPALCGIACCLFFFAAQAGWNLFRLGLVAYAPMATVLWFSMFASSDTLAFMGRHRMAWMDLGFAGCLLGFFFGLVIYRDRLKPAVVYGNLLTLLVLTWLGLAMWDGVLPDDHPLRVKWQQAAVPPAVQVEVPSAAPWYTQNKYIGANTWVWRQDLGGESIRLEKPPGETRIFVTGGSQSWGSGAASSSTTFAELLETGSRRVYNAGINGAGLRQLYRTWHGVLRHYQPDVLIADVGLNDSAALAGLRDSRKVESHLRQLGNLMQTWMEDCQRDGVQFILVLEPISGESSLKPSQELYNLFLAAADATGTPVVRADEHMVQIEGKELPWWDTAHLTPTGHRHMAEQIEPVLRDVLR